MHKIMEQTLMKKAVRPYNQPMIKPLDFDTMVQKLRGFFMSKKFKETFPQPRTSILAACEDPKTIRKYEFAGTEWPMIQTNQMWLEHDLMKEPELEGVFCLTTSYRDEPNPIEGRHNKIFPMFEAEHIGDYKHLLNTLSDLCVHLGFVKSTSDIKFFTYDELCEKYGVSILESEHEEMMWKEYGDVVAITHFPQRTSPFWNMRAIGQNKHGENIYAKCDFIICGQETIGSAERDTNVDRMRGNFHTISDGQYAEILFDKFGEERVESELEDFFALDFIERWGFGMGLTRLHRAMKLKNLL
jgi:aspartyl/asparaginyl-tRNA synthetase